MKRSLSHLLTDHRFLLHPAVAFAGPAGVPVWHVQGTGLMRRKKECMSEQAVMQTPLGTVRMVARAMRNLLVGLLIFLIVGNVAIFLTFKYMSGTDSSRLLPDLPGIQNLASVNDGLWRGSAPSTAGYKALAARDVKTIIDLRAEDIEVNVELIESLGMKLVRIPMRDGQAPTDAQVDRFMAAMKDSDGRAFVHCGAGVGRTGTMAAAYLVRTGEASPLEAVKRNLAVGPPSLEQIAFAAGLEAGEEASSNAFVTALSRVLDAPRRILVNVRHSYE